MYSAQEMRHLHRVRCGLAAIAIAIAPTVVGCGSTAPKPAAQSPTTSSPAAVTPSATPSSSPSPSPTPRRTVDPTDPATWRSGPGFIGPIRIGAGEQALRNQGYVQALPQMACGVRWEATKKLAQADLYLEFRGGDPNVLDAIVAGNRSGSSRYSFKTAEGVGIGTTTARLKEVYGDLSYGRWVNNTGYYVGWVRNTSHGSILFNVGSTNASDHTVGDGSHVTLILVTASPFHGIVDGC